jgi:hypothetical protein
MVCCLTSTSKYFIYIHDENKFNNIYKIIQKWGRDRALWQSFFWVVQPCIPSIWLLFEILSKFSLNNHYFNIFDWNELKFKCHSSYLEMNCMKYVPGFSVKFKILKILEKKKNRRNFKYIWNNSFLERKKHYLIKHQTWLEWPLGCPHSKCPAALPFIKNGQPLALLKNIIFLTMATSSTF